MIAFMSRLLAFALVLVGAPLLAQERPFAFTIQNIMRGPEVVGREPSNIRWTADGRWVYFDWLPPGSPWQAPLEPYRVRAERGAKPERMARAHMDTAGPLLALGSRSPDRRHRAVAHDGDLYLVDVRAGRARRLTETVAAETSPHYSADGKRVFFVRENNVFSVDLADGFVRQLTDVRSGPAPVDSAPPKGQRGFLEAQQRELFESVRDRVRRDSIAKAEEAARDSARVKPLYLDKGERVSSISVSPGGRALLIVTEIPADKAERTRIPNYVTESGYTEEMRMRTKVGDLQQAGRLAYMSLPSGSIRWLQLVPSDTQPPSNASVLGWNPAGDAALVFAVSRDYKARYIHRVSADSGHLATIDVLRDSAWVNGPCFGCGGWYADGSRIYFVSEADGFAHLHSVAADGGDRRKLTSGRWEVLDVDVSSDGRHFYLHTSEASPFERHLYRMAVSGGVREKLTAAPGGHTVRLSPDERMMADVHSYANRPPELYLARTSAGAEPMRVTTSPTAEWSSFKWIVPEIVMIPASDSVPVPARIYRPRDLGAQPNGAGVIFVHGAGYLHNVHNYWSSYFREYMFNHFLASKGYVVLDIDYRGSAGYGRDWRTAIYRHMGGRDLQDQVDGSRYLQKEFGIDPERVGIYGGSYGGFITLMALFTEAEHFGAGAALRSVTDWAHYNHPYTARILNTPQADTLSFRRSSPIYFAEGLEDPLLIAHGMVDVNVHFQDVVRLSQRLIELGKTGWEMAVYPVEDHAFVRPSSWTDEYRRIFELFERHLRQPAGRAADGSGR
jgi:dipeptidyl aminopeptidase/acylaminoacyl peptidase